MKIRTLLFSFFLLLSAQGIACSCGGPPTFCETIASPEYVVKAQKMADISYGMDIKILDTYVGTFDEDVIRVWGDNGYLCRVYTSTFEVGDTIILNLYQLDSLSASYFPEEEEGDYVLSVCGWHYLQVKDKTVKGPIDINNEQMSLADFDSYMHSGAYQTDCIATSAHEPGKEKFVLEFFPNPVTDQLRISSRSPIVQITIRNVLGVALKQIIPRSAMQPQIAMNDLAAGIYLLEINDIKNNSQVLKVLKQ